MPEYAPSAADEFLQLDLRSHDNCKAAVKGVSEVYHLAADMGGIGYISGSHATITLNNTLINAHMIAAVSQSSVERFMPHQITAVYEAMLPRQPLRFLLADDPGAGKTIMAGLLMKELIARGAGGARGRPGTSRVLGGNRGRWLLVLLPMRPCYFPLSLDPTQLGVYRSLGRL